MSTPNVSLEPSPVLPPVSPLLSQGALEQGGDPLSSLPKQRPNRMEGRPAFSLLEMLVVLSLLGVMLSMTWPSMRRTLGKSQLREAAKQVRTQLATARLSAMESGQPHQFRYQPGTGRFVITPLDAPLDAPFDPDEETPATSSRSSAVSGIRHSEELQDGCDRRPVQSLCGGVIFGTADIRYAVGHSNHSRNVPPPLNPANESPLGERDVSQHADWSAPIVFYPNGRSADATVRLYGDRDFQVDVNLRGVLGTVEVAVPVRVPDTVQR
jgi:prepilin-type N-terminal cleavage/methylation domain-containing protein